MLRHGSGCHFGSFWQLRLSSVSLLVGSVAVLRGRDCTTSSYRIRARRRLFSETEPNRELRGKLAGLKVSLSSGTAKKFNVFKFRRDFRWFSWVCSNFLRFSRKCHINVGKRCNFSKFLDFDLIFLFCSFFSLFSRSRKVSMETQKRGPHWQIVNAKSRGREILDAC